MAISSDYNYQEKLSLDKAKLISRTRINDLGSYELVIQYSNIASAMREDALEWLEANRLTITNPNVSFKTYEGTWSCIDIIYNEDRAIIRQRFKVDVGVGNLGNTSDQTDYTLQTGDLSRISTGGTVLKSYYWRVSNPEDYDIPSSAIEGEIWTKTANDNGDGTYDIIISKEVTSNLTSTSSTVTALYTETVTINTSADEELEEPAYAVGFVKSVTNTPLENGKYRTELRVRQASDPIVFSQGYDSDYSYTFGGQSNVTIFRNYTEAQAKALIASMNGNMVNSPSISINEFGLYDGVLSQRYD
jgi:hypothetical protein